MVQDVLNQHYAALCQRKGDLETQIQILKDQLDDIENQIGTINQIAPNLVAIEGALVKQRRKDRPTLGRSHPEVTMAEPRDDEAQNE